MTLRGSLSIADMSHALEQFIQLVGYSKVYAAVSKVKAQIENRKIQSNELLDRYSIPLGLHRIMAYRNSTKRWPKANKSAEIFGASTFAASAVEIANSLSDKGRAQLIGRIVDGLRWSGDTRNLQHEFTAVANFSQKGWDVAFVDLEGQGDFDFLIQKKSLAIEVECKTVSGDVGNAIHQTKILNFVEEFHDRLMPSAKDCCRIFEFTFDDRLPPDRESQERVINDALDCVRQNETARQSIGCNIETSTGPAPSFIIDRERMHEFAVEKVLDLQERFNGHALALYSETGVLFVCVSSKRQSKLQDYTYRYVKAASKQLSGLRPGFVWTHFVDLRDSEVEALWSLSLDGQPTGFDGIAVRVFERDERRHVHALGFSAKSHIYSKSRASQTHKQTVHGMEGPLLTYTNPYSAFSIPSGYQFP